MRIIVRYKLALSRNKHGLLRLSELYANCLGCYHDNMLLYILVLSQRQTTDIIFLIFVVLIAVSVIESNHSDIISFYYGVLTKHVLACTSNGTC